MIPQDDHRLAFRSLDGADSYTPRCGEWTEYLDHWWTTAPDGRLVFWRTWGNYAPQCNSDEQVARMVVPRTFPWAEVVQVPYVRVQDDGMGGLSVSTVPISSPSVRTVSGG